MKQSNGKNHKIADLVTADEKEDNVSSEQLELERTSAYML